MKTKMSILIVILTVIGLWLLLPAIPDPISREALSRPARVAGPHRVKLPARTEAESLTAVQPARAVPIEPALREDPVASTDDAGDIDAAPRWHPRPAGEWSGMLVNLNWTPPCETTDLCGLGMSCKRGKCLPCEGDGDCATGEACVLDHCVPASQVECRRAADCGGDSLCILTPYSATPRGNEDMLAQCVNPASGGDYLPHPDNDNLPEKDTRPSLPHDDLLKAAHEAAGRQ